MKKLIVIFALFLVGCEKHESMYINSCSNDECLGFCRDYYDTTEDSLLELFNRHEKKNLSTKVKFYYFKTAKECLEFELLMDKY